MFRFCVRYVYKYFCKRVRFISTIIPLQSGSDTSFQVWIQIEQVDFTDRMPFQPSNLKEGTSPKPEFLGANA